MADLVQILVQLLMLPVGFFVGGAIERRHLRNLDRREDQHRRITVNNLKRVTDPQTVIRAVMVTGQVVIATDYYKSFATSLKNLIGGELRSAETLMLRARREALLRAIEQAAALGATELWNVRYGFCSISQMRGNRGAMQVELFAWGTAVVRQAPRTHG